MDIEHLLLLTISIFLFSCDINEADKYYSVQKSYKPGLDIMKTGDSYSGYYCRVSKVEDKTILHFVDENGMGDVYTYPGTYKENTDSLQLLQLEPMMPYNHRMYFLEDSLLRKEGEERLEKFNKNSILKYSEEYYRTDDLQYLIINAHSEYYTERSVQGRITAYKDSIWYVRAAFNNGGIFYVDSLKIVAHPISSIRKKVQINSLIEINCKEK